MTKSISGWLRVSAGLVANMCLGTIYSWSVFRKPLEDLFDLAPAASGFPYMVFLAVFAFSMPLGGMLIDRIGPRATMVSGAGLLAIGWIVSSFAPQIWLITLFYGVVGGLGVGLAYGVSLAIAAAWFPDKKGLAMGIALVGFGLSPFVTAPLAEALILNMGVLNTFRVLGVGFVVVIGLLSLALGYPKGWKEAQAAAGSEDAEGKSGASLQMKPGEMLRSRDFYTLWLLYVVGTLTGLMVIGITSPAAQEIAGMTAGTAALVVSVMAVFNGIGRPIFGMLTDRLGARVTIVMALALVAGASLLMLLSPEGNAPLFLVAFAIFWMLLGGWLAIAPAATTALFGAKHYTRNYGIMYTAYGVGAIIGTIVSGQVRTAFGSYRMAFVPTLGLSLIAIVAALIFIKKKAPR